MRLYWALAAGAILGITLGSCSGKDAGLPTGAGGGGGRFTGGRTGAGGGGGAGAMATPGAGGSGVGGAPSVTDGPAGAGGTPGGDAPAADAPVGPAPALACANLPRPGDPYRLANPFPQLPAFDHPTAAVQAPGQPQFWYVTEQAGRVKRFANQAGVTSATVVLDLSAKVDEEGDSGLLAITFHPRFAENGQLFLSFSERGTPLRSRLSRFRTSNGGASFDPGSEEVLIEIPQPDPEKIHLNCDMRFGADGMLWVGFGDGGFDEDDRGEAQNLGSINGKILRIDVDRRGPGGEPYAIPADNPFVGRAGARGEVWALGFRNPWRWSFDPGLPGVLWVGELGSDRREELNKVVKGGNYGWNLKEGTICLEPPCNGAGMTDPFVEFKHQEGKSVTVGSVYRGQELPALRDRLIYGDFVSGHVWALPADRSPKPEVILNTALAIVSFAEPLEGGELMMLDYDGGRFHKVVAAPAGEAALPSKLSQTGCLVGAAAPPAHLQPYDVNAQLFSDGASKRRWMALPAGGKITIAGDGDFDFPPGTTLVKEFTVGATKVETRLFARHADGAWGGYSYGWNAEQTEATLLGLTSVEPPRSVGPASWNHPTRYHCLACHTKEAGYTLGPEIAQLNRNFAYPDGTRNQLSHLESQGLLAAALPGPPASLPALPAPDSTAPVAARARAYLHANCSSCHRPNVRFPDGIDLRYTTALGSTRTCNVEAIYGGFDGVQTRVAPGRPAVSLVPRFMRSTEEFRMPLVGTTVVDDAGAALIESWIAGLSGCN